MTSATRPFVSLFLANSMMSISTSMQFVLAPLYVISRGASDFEAGLTITCFMISALLLRPFSGHLVDARGRQAVVLAGAVVFAVTSAVLIGSPEVWLFLVIRMLQGIGFSLVGTASMTIATDLLPPQRLEGGLGLLGLEVSITQAVGPVLALWVVDVAGFEVAFMIAATAAAVGVLLRLVDHQRVRELDAARRTGRAGRLRPQLIASEAWRPATVAFLLTFAFAAVSTFLAAHALSRGLDSSAAFFASMGLSMAVARALLGRIHALLGERLLISFSIIAHATALLLVWWTSEPGGFIVAGLLFGWGIGVFSPSFTSIATRATAPARRGLATATIFLAMDAATAIGGLAFGAVAVVAGSGAVFPVAAALVLVGLLAYLLLLGGRPEAARMVGVLTG